MRIGTAPDIGQRLLLMVAAARREPSLICRQKRRPAAPGCIEVPGFGDDVGVRAEAHGLTGEKLGDLIAD